MRKRHACPLWRIQLPEGVFSVDWSFDGPNGAVTVRKEEERAVCQAIRTTDGGGLYKAWLYGASGKALLGTLIPEGGALRLRRVLEIAALERQGAWPPTGAEVVLAYPFAPEVPLPSDWCWTDCPQRLIEDAVVSRCLHGVRRALLKRDMDGFFLAFPWSRHEAFPIPPLFCLSHIEMISGRRYVVFRFSRQGCPELLHKFSAGGENRDAT